MLSSKIGKNSFTRKQDYLDVYIPVLNLNEGAESKLGVKHTEKSKKLISSDEGLKHEVMLLGKDLVNS